jgi:hypothetical protein
MVRGAILTPPAYHRTLLGKPMKRAALYARVSTNNGQDPQVQLRELREYADLSDWAKAGEYVDIGITGLQRRTLSQFAATPIRLPRHD